LFGDNRATPRLKRPRPINASFPSSPGDSQKNSLRVCWRVLHPRGICVGNWRRVRRARSLPYGGRLTPVFTLKLLPGRVPASLRHWFDPMPLQWCCGQYCVRDWTARPGCAGNPDPGSPRHFESPAPRPRWGWEVPAARSYFLGDQLPMPGQQPLRCDDGGHLRQKLPS